MAPRFRFFDAVDTVRTRRELGEQRIAIAQLMLALLRRETIALSQSQAFDSGSILLAGNNPYFLALIKSGRIQVPLFRAENLKSAFLAAVTEPTTKFSAWPEIDKGQVDRAAVADAIKTGKLTTGIPQSVGEKLEVIERLNAVIAESPCHVTAEPSAYELKSLLEKGWHEEPKSSPLRPILEKLVGLNSNYRSVHFNAIEGMAINHELREAAHSFVDMCYNSVVIDSLRAAGALTSTSAWAVQKWERMTTYPSLPMIAGETPAIPGLRQVGWEDIFAFLEQTKDIPFNQQENEAQAAGLIAKLAFERPGLNPYYIIPKLVSSIASAAVWGGIGWVAAELTGSPSTVAQIIAGFGALQGFLTGESYVIKVAENVAGTALQKRLVGLLQQFRRALGDE